MQKLKQVSIICLFRFVPLHCRTRALACTKHYHIGVSKTYTVFVVSNTTMHEDFTAKQVPY